MMMQLESPVGSGKSCLLGLRFVEADVIGQTLEVIGSTSPLPGDSRGEHRFLHWRFLGRCGSWKSNSGGHGAWTAGRRDWCTHKVKMQEERQRRGLPA